MRTMSLQSCRLCVTLWITLKIHLYSLPFLLPWESNGYLNGTFITGSILAYTQHLALSWEKEMATHSSALA